MSSVQGIRCYLCDHCFVRGEEPWLMFNKRLQADGQLYCSLAELLGGIVETLIEEGKVHSTFLCASCYADIVEYESLERRFKVVRQHILDSFNRNLTLNPLMKANEMTACVNSAKMLFYVHDADVGRMDENLIIENGIDSDADLVEEVFDDEQYDESINEHFTNANVTNNVSENETENIVIASARIETDIGRDKLDFAAFNEHVAQNSLPPDMLHLSDGFAQVNGNVAGIPLEYNDLIIYEGNIQNENKQDNTSGFNSDTDGSQGLQSCKDSEGISNDFILYSDQDNSANILNDVVKSASRDSILNSDLSTDLGIEIDTNQDRKTDMKLDSNINTNYEMVSKPVGKLEDGKFVCLICEASEEYDYEPLLEHLLICHNIKNYMCKVCKQGYSESDGLKKHLISEASCSAYKCGICAEIFENDLLLRLHKRQHFTNAKAYECQFCYKKCTTKGALQAHINTHTGLRPFKCMKCNKSFSSTYTLQTHMKIHMDRMRQYQCDKCDKAFFSKQNLSQHMKLHVPYKSFVCEICLKSFLTQHSLTVHMIVHSGRKPFVCDVCGKAFARRPEIKNHERTHTGERPFKCDICSMAFAQRSNLTSHKKSTHFNEKLHRCTQCDRSFKRKRLLYYHVLAVHTGERPHKCNICGAGFVYPEHFKKHMLIHSGHKPYACEICGKQFNSRDNRNAHRFVHSDKKPYECLECGAGFMRKPLLLFHMNKAMHFNDTIIVNQPQFVSQQVSNVDKESHIKIEDENFIQSNDNKCIEMVDNNFSETNDNALINSNENVFVKSNEIVEMLSGADNIFANIVNGVNHHSDVNENEIITSADQFLKFENNYNGDHQTLIWSDISGNIRV